MKKKFVTYSLALCMLLIIATPAQVFASTNCTDICKVQSNVKNYTQVTKNCNVNYTTYSNVVQSIHTSNCNVKPITITNSSCNVKVITNSNSNCNVLTTNSKCQNCNTVNCVKDACGNKKNNCNQGNNCSDKSQNCAQCSCNPSNTNNTNNISNNNNNNNISNNNNNNNTNNNMGDWDYFKVIQKTGEQHTKKT